VGDVTLHYWLGGDHAGLQYCLWHGFLGTSYSWHKVMHFWLKLDTECWCLTCVAMVIRQTRGTKGYDGLALAEEFRLLIRNIGFWSRHRRLRSPLRYGCAASASMGFKYPDEVSGLVYIKSLSCCKPYWTNHRLHA